jgi:ABC-type anion transport system duplicated permease subunit
MMGLHAFFRAHGWEIARLTFEHLWLTLSAMLLAAAIGLPLGILLTRKRRLAGPVIAFANIVQTVPSLALFGLLLPVPWLGDNAARLAILALTGYALLPILRNTYAGVGSVDPALVDVSNALGMNGMQRLIKVELPRRLVRADWGNSSSAEWRASTTGWCWRERSRQRCWRWRPILASACWRSVSRFGGRASLGGGSLSLVGMRVLPAGVEGYATLGA